MGLLFPLFLLTGISLAIPVLIHLFNLRKFKTIAFPHSRFLKNLQLQSNKQNKVQQKLLLLFRLLFLTALILAFAQPFLKSSQIISSAHLKIIYIDNSYSMSVKKGVNTLLDRAKENARLLLKSASNSDQFIVLTNNPITTYNPQSAEALYSSIDKIDYSPKSLTNSQVYTLCQGLLQAHNYSQADLFYYSDFQKNNFSANIEKSLLKGLSITNIYLQENTRNSFIDTAYFLQPNLIANKPNQLVVKTKQVGEPLDEKLSLQMSDNKQLKTATVIDFNGNPNHIDTFSFNPNGIGWNEILLTLNDPQIPFDDSFRIAARVAPEQAVLILNEGQTSPYLQAAFSAVNGFQVTTQNINSSADWNAYNLIVLNQNQHLSLELGKRLKAALDKGKSVCLFLNNKARIDDINQGFPAFGDLKITGKDTQVQQVTQILQGNDLVKQIFESIPSNMQLPTVNWHFNLQAGLMMNGQNILSFRNGDPFLAQYNFTEGKLYVFTAGSDDVDGNFSTSYFFLPFLNEMAIQSSVPNIFALSIGQNRSIKLPFKSILEKQMVHIYNNSTDLIPPQNTSQGGVEIQFDPVVQQADFYHLTTSQDTLEIGLNTNREESKLQNLDIKTLEKQSSSTFVKWLPFGDPETLKLVTHSNPFPIWKLCCILALILLLIETYIIVHKNKMLIIK